MPISSSPATVLNLAAAAGPAPAWISYVAFAVSMLTAAVSTATFLRNQVRDRRKDGQEYAVKVAAWTGPDTGEDPMVYRFRSVVVHNGSAQPIFNTVVVLRTAQPGEIPGESDLVNVSVGLVPPGEKTEHQLGALEVVQDLVQRPVTVFFNDAHGRRWERDEAGQLRRRDRVRAATILPRNRRAADGSVVPHTR